MSDRVLDTLRAIAWEHAKAELRSMLVTFYDDEEQYGEIQKAIQDFVKQMEDDIGV